MEDLAKEWDKTHKKALKWAALNYHKASRYHKAAFCNSVAYFVTGISGGSGPSIREHLTTWSLTGDGERQQVETSIGVVTVQFPDGRLKPAGNYTFQEAVTICAPICFGQLPKLALKVYEMEHCFDDDPKDLKLIKQWQSQCKN